MTKHKIWQNYRKKCLECSALFFPEYDDQAHCSEECAKTYYSMEGPNHENS